ncbi:hypothetical protein D5952_14230 [Salmonella enterica subsp. enterica]|nr:hypothetical protein [Salmonella enterica subsp. enterica serovar Bonn]EBZ5939339.1 hypothetical protein [Salmonella enterica subsp. enterica serovar Muenchen]MLZ41082.1 hypothetical protein [Salmonella enterica subsp. enterica serovar Bonn]
MSIFIESSDQYFNIALSHIVKRPLERQSICIVDLESFSTLRALITCIEDYGEQFNFIFIKGKGILSGMFNNLTTVSKRTKMKEFPKKINRCNQMPYGRIIKLLNSYKNLTMLTPKEIKSVYGVRAQHSLIDAASFIGVDTKICYQRMISVARKLNLKSSIHVQYFIHSEFTIAEIGRIIRQH